MFVKIHFTTSSVNQDKDGTNLTTEYISKQEFWSNRLYISIRIDLERFWMSKNSLILHICISFGYLVWQISWRQLLVESNNCIISLSMRLLTKFGTGTGSSVLSLKPIISFNKVDFEINVGVQRKCSLFRKISTNSELFSKLFMLVISENWSKRLSHPNNFYPVLLLQCLEKQTKQ